MIIHIQFIKYVPIKYIRLTKQELYTRKTLG